MYDHIGAGEDVLGERASDVAKILHIGAGFRKEFSGGHTMSEVPHIAADDGGIRVRAAKAAHNARPDISQIPGDKNFHAFPLMGGAPACPVLSYQTFQAARPVLHNSSRYCLSRNVSMHDQNPSWRNPTSWSSAARRSMGSRSQMVSSCSM